MGGNCKCEGGRNLISLFLELAHIWEGGRCGGKSSDGRELPVQRRQTFDFTILDPEQNLGREGGRYGGKS